MEVQEYVCILWTLTDM